MDENHKCISELLLKAADCLENYTPNTPHAGKIPSSLHVYRPKKAAD
jgi:hypothetical protein